MDGPFSSIVHDWSENVIFRGQLCSFLQGNIHEKTSLLYGGKPEDPGKLL